MAVFAGLELFQPASGYTLEATTSTVSSAATNNISVALSSGNFADPSFESPNVGSSFQNDPAASPWTFSGNAGVTGNSSTLTSSNPPAPQGSQAAFLEDTGSISQTVSLAAGTYALMFEAAQSASSEQTVQVLVDGNPISIVAPINSAYAAYTANFTVAAGTHSITLAGLNLVGGDNTALIDQMSIEAIPNQLVDPGFEAPAQGQGVFTYDPKTPAWTFTGTAGLAGNGSGFTANNPIAPQGAEVAFLQMTGSASQSVTLPAGTYSISLEAAQRNFAQVGGQTIDVLVDNVTVSTITPSSSNYALYTTSTFNSTAGTHTIEILGLDPHGGDNTALIDAVTIVPGSSNTNLTGQAPSQTVTANQPLDPGFEAPALGAGRTAYLYDPAGSPWTFSGFAGVAGNGSGFTANNPIAPQGGQVAFLQMTGSASQSVTLSAGTFSISFEAAQRNIAQVGGQTIEVLLDNVAVSTITPVGINYASYTTTTFTVAAGAHTLEFLGLDPHGGDNTALIDQVSITAAQVNQPLDPGFEAPSLDAGPTAYQYDPTGSPWAFSGYAGVTGNGSGFTANNPNAPQGSQVAFIQITGSLSQSVVLAGGTYSISLDAAQRSIGSSNQTIEVLVDGNSVGNITPSGTSYAEYDTASFTVSSGATRLSSWGSIRTAATTRPSSTRCS